MIFPLPLNLLLFGRGHRSAPCSWRQFFQFPKDFRYSARSQELRIDSHFWWSAWRFHNHSECHTPKQDSWVWPWSPGSKQPNDPNHHCPRQHRPPSHKCFPMHIPNLWELPCILLQYLGYWVHSEGTFRSEILKTDSTLSWNWLDWKLGGCHWNFRSIYLELSEPQLGNNEFPWNQILSWRECTRRDWLLIFGSMKHLWRDRRPSNCAICRSCPYLFRSWRQPWG